MSGFIVLHFMNLALQSKHVYEIRPMIAAAVTDSIQSLTAATPDKTALPVTNGNVRQAERQADGSIRIVLTGATEIEGKSLIVAPDPGRLGAWKCRSSEIALRYLPPRCN